MNDETVRVYSTKEHVKMLDEKLRNSYDSDYTPQQNKLKYSKALEHLAKIRSCLVS